MNRSNKMWPDIKDKKKTKKGTKKSTEEISNGKNENVNDPLKKTDPKMSKCASYTTRGGAKQKYQIWKDSKELSNKKEDSLISRTLKKPAERLHPENCPGVKVFWHRTALSSWYKRMMKLHDKSMMTPSVRLSCINKNAKHIYVTSRANWPRKKHVWRITWGQRGGVMSLLMIHGIFAFI